MEIIIIHYHLRKGGVSSIIKMQAESIHQYMEHTDFFLLTGESSVEAPFYEYRHVSEKALNYLHKTNYTKDEIIKLRDDCIDILKPLMYKNTILHIHNLNLGKNPILTLAVNVLIHQGVRVVNHCHDFAEDRPENMQFFKHFTDKLGISTKELFYPNKRNVFYISLNSVDEKRLQNEGIPSHQVQRLFNPVNFPENAPDPFVAKQKIIQTFQLDKEKLIFIYPVRAIRRKNIAEFILLCALFKEYGCFLITLPPENPEEIMDYVDWKFFCKAQQIPVIFEAGLNMKFETIIAGADKCLTTSIREGFGMVFVEPWIYQTEVFGRRLNNIVQDLETQDLKYPGLYDRIIVTSENLDFADCSNDLKKEIILNVLENREERKRFLETNPDLEKLLEKPDWELIKHNRDKVLDHFSEENFSKQLYAIYQQLIQAK